MIYTCIILKVYDGVWGYNTLLAMSSTSCVFFAFSGYSFILGLVNVGATGVSHYAMRTNMTLQVRSIFVYCIVYMVSIVPQNLTYG